jgi:hypothetical protein
MHCNFQPGWLYHPQGGGISPWHFLKPLSYGDVQAMCLWCDQYGNVNTEESPIDVHIQFCDLVVQPLGARK